MTPAPSPPRSLSDFEILAQAALSPMAWEYLAGGVADEETLHANRREFGRWSIVPRVCRDVSSIDTSLQIFGRRHEAPILLAPAAYHRLFHPDAELESVRGANAAGITFCASIFSNVTLEAIAAASTAPTWFQLYVQKDRGLTRDLVQRAAAAGFEALVITADVPVNGPRERELRAGFHLPPGAERANLAHLGPAVAAAAHRPFGRNIYSAVRTPDLTWDDIAWIRSLTSQPMLLKGVLHPDDASAALAAGCDGIIVSNHGGRSLDSVPGTLAQLPAIAAAAGRNAPILFDGGIRRGTDVIKALALGATAVCVGRPYLWGLAVAGAQGVAQVVDILRMELEMAMGLSGAPTLDDVRRTLLQPAFQRQ
ncbi:MAG: alpha-hydroxy acid oxidase [Bryobacteraceae bacterium]|nr:alpha-hydroxy acid oxidase [Bryobacteraceae bacterium]